MRIAVSENDRERNKSRIVTVSSWVFLDFYAWGGPHLRWYTFITHTHTHHSSRIVTWCFTPTQPLQLHHGETHHSSLPLNSKVVPLTCGQYILFNAYISKPNLERRKKIYAFTYILLVHGCYADCNQVSDGGTGDLKPEVDFSLVVANACFVSVTWWVCFCCCCCWGFGFGFLDTDNIVSTWDTWYLSRINDGMTTSLTKST